MQLRLFKKHPAQLEVRTQRTIRFIGEQDGPSERELKTALGSLFADRPVLRAYLARLHYGDAKVQEVALCIAGPEKRSLVEDISKLFACRFASDVHLDIVFVSDAQEVELGSVCQPFFRAG